MKKSYNPDDETFATEKKLGRLEFDEQRKEYFYHKTIAEKTWDSMLVMVATHDKASLSSADDFFDGPSIRDNVQQPPQIGKLDDRQVEYDEERKLYYVANTSTSYTPVREILDPQRNEEIVAHEEKIIETGFSKFSGY
jgi:hypothetical protein